MRGVSALQIGAAAVVVRGIVSSFFSYSPEVLFLMAGTKTEEIKRNLNLLDNKFRELSSAQHRLAEVSLGHCYKENKNIYNPVTYHIKQRMSNSITGQDRNRQ